PAFPGRSEHNRCGPIMPPRRKPHRPRGLEGYVEPSPGSRRRHAITAPITRNSPPRVTNPAVIETAPAHAAAVAPTINASAWALPASPNAVPRRLRGTFAAISVLLAGSIAACSNEIAENATTYIATPGET